MNKLFCDLKTDEEKANFFLSGRGYETGVIAIAIQNDVAMAYQRCAEYRREIAQLREQQTEPAPREPLTDEQIDALVATASITERNLFRRFARAIEAAHGITTNKEQA